MSRPPRRLPRVVYADQESPRDRLARVFAAECAAAALEVFERQRKRRRGPEGRSPEGPTAPGT